MVENITLIRAILELFKFIKESFTSGSFSSTFREGLVERLAQHDAQFSALSKEYNSAISDFQRAVLRASSYEEIGEAVIELRASRNLSALERSKLAGERKEFRVFMEEHKKHKLSVMLAVFNQYLSACEAFFHELDNEGLGHQSWATALIQLARGEENHTGISPGLFGSVERAKDMLSSKSDEAMRRMADVAGVIAGGNAKLIGLLKSS